MNRPKVSVIMTVFNGERYVAKAVDSILNQTFQDFELIIVNDGSTDGTEQALSPYLSNPKMRYHVHDRNRGYAEGMNKGVSLAQGCYIAIQDADDISLPRRLEEEVEALESHPDCELVFSPVLLIDVYGEVFTRFGGMGSGELLNKEAAFYHLYIEGNFIPNPSVMMRTRHIRSIFYNTSLLVCNDFEHNLRLVHDYPIIEICHPLVKMRRGREHHTMSSDGELNFKIERKILRIIRSEFSQVDPKVSTVHYAQAMSNHFFKEGMFYGGEGRIGKGLSLVLKALMYNPFNGRIYKSLIPRTIIGLLRFCMRKTAK